MLLVYKVLFQSLQFVTVVRGCSAAARQSVASAFPRKKLVARRSVASAFTNEQQSRSVTFYGKEEQRSEQTARFTAAASDTEFVTTRRSVTFYGGEEQRNE